MTRNQHHSEIARALSHDETSVELFDGDLRHDGGTGGLARLIDPTGAWQGPRRGETLGEVLGRAAAEGFVAAAPGLDAARLSGRVETALRGYRSGIELPLVSGALILCGASPRAEGGIAVCFRKAPAAESGIGYALGQALTSVELGLVLWDSDFTVRACNEAWERLLAPVQVGSSILDAGHAMANAGIQRLDGSMDTGQQVKDEVTEAHGQPRRQKVRRADGDVVQISSFPTPDGGVLAVAVDTSASEAAEVRAREMLRDAVEALEEGLMLYDHDLRAVMWNAAYARLAYPSDAPPVVGETIFEQIERLIDRDWILVPEGLSKPELLEQLGQAVEARARNLELRHADGMIIDVSVYETPLGGILVSLRDMTEARTAEAAAREADALLRTIVEATPSTFVVSRLSDGKVIYQPQISRERFGEIEHTVDFFPDPELREAYIATLKQTGRVTDYPLRLKRKDGTIMDGLTSARIIEHGGEQLIVSATRDVTEYLAMQAELARQTEIAHQNEKLSALGELMAGVAHELNNPLSIVAGYAAMLSEEPLPDRQARQVKRIASASERCTRIVKAFLAMARQRPATIEPCAPRDLVAIALDVAGYGLKSAGASIEVDLSRDLPEVAADADQIAQVFANLLANAEHALSGMGAEATVMITARVQKDHVVVLFADNGPGVPEDLRARVFEPFFTTKDVGEGTGVGLAFCHRIVASHDGTLSLGTSPDGGALFEVRLPIAHGPRTASASAAVEPLRGTRVLIVEDEADVAEVMRDALETGGCEVTVCLRAEDALVLCVHTPFDAVLSDLRMPGMDGRAFLNALRTAAPGQAARFAFLTGDAMGQGAAEFIASTGRPYLSKPAYPSELFALVASLSEAP